MIYADYGFYVHLDRLFVYVYGRGCPVRLSEENYILSSERERKHPQKGFDERMDPMMEMFVFETNQNLEHLEQILIQSEKNGSFSAEDINDIFRIMHTLKGSAAMMVVNEVAALAHAMEDIFFYLREKKPKQVDCSSLVDILLQAEDFIHSEMEKLSEGETADGKAQELIALTRQALAFVKDSNGEKTSHEVPGAVGGKNQAIAENAAGSSPVLSEKANVFQALLFYQEDCEMENIRAYAVLNNLKEFVHAEWHYPEKILEEDSSTEIIREKGFSVCFITDKTQEEMETILNRTIFLRKLDLVALQTPEEWMYWPKTEVPAAKEDEKKQAEQEQKAEKVEKAETEKKSDKKTDNKENSHQTMISVNVAKLDLLMDLVGELVIAEAMVTQNPDLQGMEMENFSKAARQLRKISNELQDGVMAIRMVPLTATFQKMNRIVRDMSQKLNKTVELHLVGEETEVDKNVIEHIADPLMHLIRNSIDHGIELPQERNRAGKPSAGNITLEAKNAGSEVIITIVDDGKGFDRAKILKKARENHLIFKNEEDLTDKEIYGFIFAPGFSTNDKVTEFFGRGVGMDVVMKNIHAVGGTISADSTPGEGCSITLKIPLTLAIITGMNIRIGSSRYTIPIAAIQEAFKPAKGDLVVDPEGNEMVMVRGCCHPIVRLHALYKIKTQVQNLLDGIMIMVKTDKMVLGMFADELLGQQQIVVKPIPGFIKQLSRTDGISGCTLLGDGSISLILDPADIANRL